MFQINSKADAAEMASALYIFLLKVKGHGEMTVQQTIVSRHLNSDQGLQGRLNKFTERYTVEGVFFDEINDDNWLRGWVAFLDFMENCWDDEICCGRCS